MGKVAKIQGSYFIWPSGKKTHMRFIYEAVKMMRPLPKGFYEAAKKFNKPNLNRLAEAAKKKGLKCTVTK